MIHLALPYAVAAALIGHRLGGDGGVVEEAVAAIDLRRCVMAGRPYQSEPVIDLLFHESPGNGFCSASTYVMGFCHDMSGFCKAEMGSSDFMVSYHSWLVFDNAVYIQKSLLKNLILGI